MNAPDGSPRGVAIAGLNQLLESEALARLDAADSRQAWTTAAVAVAKIVDVIQQLLDVSGSNNGAAKWLAAQGFDVAERPPPPPITRDELR
ncbi:hypothetical protein [Mycolicibacter sinensis]